MKRLFGTLLLFGALAASVTQAATPKPAKPAARPKVHQSKAAKQQAKAMKKQNARARKDAKAKARAHAKAEKVV